MYVVIVPLNKTEIKPSSLKMPQFSKRLEKFFETKQNLYIKFFKNKSARAEGKYMNYKNCFEKLKTEIKEKLSRLLST